MPGTEKKATNESAQTKKDAKGFTAEERAAMRERAKELKAEEKADKDKAEGENNVLAKIAELPEPERTLAQRIHEIIKDSAPTLSPKTWYGMPAYASKDGKIVCFFQSAQKFDTRYSTLGFNDTAKLDDGNMWPTAYGITELTPAVEQQIAELIKRAVN